jgi:uncharacterized protein (TIRG00374 family)
MRYIWNIIFSVIILIILFYFIDVNTLINVLLAANPLYLVLAIIFYFTLNVIMSFRIKVILRELGNNIPLKDAIISDFTGMLASDFTPARSGYFFAAFDISSRLKIPLEKTMISIFGPQLLEFVIKALCVGILVIFVLNQFSVFEDQSVYILFSSAFVLLVILFFASLLFSKKLLNKFSFIKGFPFGRKFFSLFHLMQDKSDVLLKKKWTILGLTFGSWLLKTCEWFCLAKSLNISLFDNSVMEFLFIGIFQASITLIHFIPIPTIAGAGTSEAAFAGILFLFGVPAALGVAFGLMTRALMIFVDFILGISNLSVYIEKEKWGGILADIEDVEKRAMV